MKDLISAVVLTKNEEKNIIDCIKSLNFCDEIIIIDDYSTDKTLDKIRNHKSEILNKSRIQIFQRKLNGDFASQRNYGLKQAKGEWILYVDADERVSSDLKKAINCACTTSQVVQDRAYYIKRRDWWWGRQLKHGEVRKVRSKGIIRFVKKDSGIFMGNVHEVFHTAKHVSNLAGYLEHYPHPKVRDFIDDINEYSSIRAQELYNQGKTANFLQITLLPFGKFILNYFFYLGFLDGPAGFAYAFFMSFHSFLVRAKLYQLINNAH